MAHLAVEYRSHGIDDHVELYLLRLELEQVLADEFPTAFDQHCGDWAEDEAAAQHHPMITSQSCSLCRMIAAHEGNPPGTSVAAWLIVAHHTT